MTTIDTLLEAARRHCAEEILPNVTAWNEAGEVVQNKWIDLLRSNLRAPADIPLREVRTANPGGVPRPTRRASWA